MAHRTSPRSRRLADEIQRDLAGILRSEVRNPRLATVTITHVDVTADLAHAKVHVTSLAGKEHGPEAVESLTRSAGFLRSALAKRLTLYSVPQLSFAYDDSIESGMRLSQLIDEAVATDRHRDSGDEPAAHGPRRDSE